MPQSLSDKKPLRIGLLIDSYSQPQWVRRIIDEISSSSIARVELVVKNKLGEEEREPPLKRLWNRRRHLLYSAYTKLDNRLTTISPDAFQKVSVLDLVGAVPVLEVEPLMYKFTDRLDDEDVSLIKEYQLDVALRFGFRILKGEVLEIAKHGVWSYHHDNARIYRGGPPGFWEVMKDDPITGSMLQILNEQLDNGRVIYRSWAATINRFSVKKNSNNYYWKTSAFVMRKLKELHETGEISVDSRELSYSSQPYLRKLYKTPANSEMFGLLLGLGSRAVTRLFEKISYSENWSLAYRFLVDSDDLNNTFYKYKYLLPPKDRFWADPFPVRQGDRYFVFFEEFVYRKDKAHISVMEFKKGEGPTEPVTVLERPYHLSYPFIFEWEGNQYMIPETGSNNRVELYRCKSFPNEWEFESVLLEANNPTDATLIEASGRWWMFVTIAEPGVSVNWDELHVFHAETPLGPWTPHRRNPVKSDVRSSRPAGRMFHKNGSLYRPAQDCSRRYGYAIAINEVKRLTPDDYFEQEVSRITPEWHESIIGAHTLNSVDDLTVIDCLVKTGTLSDGPNLPAIQPQRRRVSDKENVLQLIHGFIQGGSERQMIQLTKLLRDSGRYNVHVACLKGGGALRHEVEDLGFNEITEFPLTSFYDSNMLVQLRRFQAFVKERDIQLIHTHEFYSNIFGLAGAKLAQIPVRIGSRRETKGMRSSFQKKVERLAFRLAHNVVTNAEAVKDHLVKEGVSQEKISVVHNGLDLERLTSRRLSRLEVLKLLGLPEELGSSSRKFVTIVANLQHEVKDYPMFLRAAKRTHEIVPEATFLLAGEGPLIASARAQADELGILDSTFFLGRCNHVPALLSISDVCVLSSKAEGFSNSILEYMAAARPVVATEVGGAREAIIDGETGYLVKSGDDCKMAECIIALLQNPERAVMMGDKGRRVVEEKFSCDAQLEKTEELYGRLLSQNGRATAVSRERRQTESI
ncbi:MAG: glucosamine inositolphosphorylceramide transferase family protein [Pyrinomonadaceae bacterium]